jgi:hypothetical protein
MPDVIKTASLRPNPNPIDPDVKVPAAVTRAREAAEAAQRAAYPDQTPTPAPTPTTTNTGDTITIAPAATVTPPGNPEPTPPAPVAPAQPVPQATDETWEHRYNSERGRHNQTRTLLAQTTDRLTALEALVQDLRSAPPAPTTPAPTAEPTRLVTEQEANEFGPEMIDVMGRRAREAVSPELAELRRQMQLMEQKLTGTVTTVTRNARQDMMSTLDTRMPTWREVNMMDEFKAWLALPDPYSGAKRHAMLTSAFEQNDTPRVLNFFKGFVSELAATTPAGDLPVPTTPAARQPDKPGLETLAAPGRARTPAQNNAPAEKQIITTADINAFYAAKAKGIYDGREAEFKQLENELFAAQREGRVRAV